MRAFAVILLPTFCIGCGSHPSASASLHDQRQWMLNEIAHKCGIPRDVFHLIGNDKVVFQPKPNDDFDRLSCALREVNKLGSPFKVGFVGNEYYSGRRQSGNIQ